MWGRMEERIEGENGGEDRGEDGGENGGEDADEDVGVILDCEMRHDPGWSKHGPEVVQQRQQEGFLWA